MTKAAVTGESPERTDVASTETPKPQVLRWEWRTFARHVQLPPAWRHEPTADSAATSDETYFVSLRSTHNVKLRQGRLEVKQLRRVDSRGLELWDPVLTVALPSTVDALAELWRVWQVAPPGPSESTITAEDLVHRVVEQTPWLRPVRVSKRRVPLALAPCMCERVELLIDGERWESIAIESDDPREVHAAIRRLGLEGIPNTNYPGMLKSLVASPGQAQTPTQEKR